ncbi:hypothetical protein Salat_0217700 [Sesamum alatum]|uniref:DUF4283 domain-containing protein n=1 Tax=Sesamum alatum TaxID=300844 RepID=A0AAE2CY18_9LAMI|nr:hypothetical protein Salat_0217700 [Sesamum alatum]
MELELDRLGKALDFGEGDSEEVVIPKLDWSKGTAETGWFVCGRMITWRIANFDALRNYLIAPFHSVRGMDVRFLEGARFFVRFNHVLDHERAMERCPWTFEKNLLIECSVMRILRQWIFNGNHLGRFIELELDKGGRAWGSVMCIRVSLDVEKSLCRSMKLSNEAGSRWWFCSNMRDCLIFATFVVGWAILLSIVKCGLQRTLWSWVTPPHLAPSCELLHRAGEEISFRQGGNRIIQSEIFGTDP